MNKELIELMEWLRPYTPAERLEMLLDAARTVGMPELEAAIENYWNNDALSVLEKKTLDKSWEEDYDFCKNKIDR